MELSDLYSRCNRFTSVGPDKTLSQVTILPWSVCLVCKKSFLLLLPFFFFLKIYFILFSCVCLHVRMYVPHVHACPQSPEEGVRFPRIKGNCEPPCR